MLPSKRNLLFLVFLLFISLSAQAREEGLSGKEEREGTSSFYSSIAQLNQEQPDFGTFQVSGYVLRKYQCPPCPEGARCKPCSPDYVIISEVKEIPEHDRLTEKELLVYVDQRPWMDRLEMGKRYSFLVQVLDVNTTTQRLNNLKLVYFQAVPEEAQF